MASTSELLDPTKSPSSPLQNSSSLSPTIKPANAISDPPINPPLSFLPPSSLPSPPAPLTITPLTHDTLPTYRRLLSLLLPIPYRAPFSTEPLQPSSPCIALLAHWHPPQPQSQQHSPPPPTIIGAIQARICPSPQDPHNCPTLYIQTLVLLAPYRHLGVATHLLAAMLALAREREPRLGEAWAHVWEKSEEALEWYVKRGFVVDEQVVGGYYRRLNPAGARVVRLGMGEREEGDGVG